jgi:hypothetical protein
VSSPARSLRLQRPERSERDGDRPVWLALGLAALLLLLPAAPALPTMVVLVAIVATLVVSARWRIPGVALVVLLVGGLALRLAITSGVGSDVLDVTQAAIRRMLDGGNPYGVGYAESRPPGAPYPYGPIGLLLYLPVLGAAGRLELVSAILILSALALRGRLIGLAIYAMAPVLITTASDGSNDTTAGLILLVAFAIAAARPRLGALVLAIGVGFKPYLAAWLPALLVWGGWPVVAVFGVVSLVIWAPVLVLWGPASFLTSLQMADEVHRVPSWSLGSAYAKLTQTSAPRALLNDLRLVLGGLVALATMRWSRTIDAVILGGTLVYLVTLFAGFWSTYAYFAAIAPILCWRVDDWLGMPARPLLAPAGEVVVATSG